MSDSALTQSIGSRTTRSSDSPPWSTRASRAGWSCPPFQLFTFTFEPIPAIVWKLCPASTVRFAVAAGAAAAPAVPLRVSQSTEYGAVASSAPRAAPSRKNCTPATPTLSDASADTVTVPDTVLPAAGAVMDTVGAVGSAPCTVTPTAADVVWLPEPSLARAVSECAPLAAVAVFQLTEYGAVASSAPSTAPSSRNWTPATPTSSAAVADTVTVPDSVLPAEGAERVTVGGTVSTPALTGAFMSAWTSAAESARL